MCPWISHLTNFIGDVTVRPTFEDGCMLELMQRDVNSVACDLNRGGVQCGTTPPKVKCVYGEI